MSGKAKPTAFPEHDHNHGSCEHDLLDRAGRVFEAKGMKMTDLRRNVLNEIAGSHQALGAYEILERLATKGQRLAPISVYRAIDALHEVGLVHRLESRNAFFACHSPHAPGRDQVILACDRCGRVAEMPGEQVFSAINKLVEAAQFEVRRTVTEISGVCSTCRAGH
jgi:Fur family transcriptional regulator, zinc uptake regulator